MAKVVLVWNEHPVEVVAGFHARKVAKILREKYGHEVVLEKVPFAQTNYGIVHYLKAGKEREAAKELKELPSSLTIAQRYADTHRAPAFNFHTSPPTALDTTDYNKGCEITGSRSAFIVEIPAVYDRLSYKRRELQGRKANAIDNVPVESLFETAMREQHLQAAYHASVTKLREQKQLTSPAVSEKIASAIHERITKQSSR